MPSLGTGNLNEGKPGRLKKTTKHKCAKREPNLVAEPVRSAPEPVIVRQALDGAHSTDRDILQGKI